MPSLTIPEGIRNLPDIDLAAKAVLSVLDDRFRKGSNEALSIHSLATATGLTSDEVLGALLSLYDAKYVTGFDAGAEGFQWGAVGSVSVEYPTLALSVDQKTLPFEAEPEEAERDLITR